MNYRKILFLFLSLLSLIITGYFFQVVIYSAQIQSDTGLLLLNLIVFTLARLAVFSLQIKKPRQAFLAAISASFKNVGKLLTSGSLQALSELLCVAFVLIPILVVLVPFGFSVVAFCSNIILSILVLLLPDALFAFSR